MTSEPRLFGLWSTFPWHLRKHSAFLALHSGSIGLFVLLLVGHCGLSVWPLANTLKANNYRREYTVIDPTNARTCESQEKPYQVLLPILHTWHCWTCSACILGTTGHVLVAMSLSEPHSDCRSFRLSPQLNFPHAGGELCLEDVTGKLLLLKDVFKPS